MSTSSIRKVYTSLSGSDAVAHPSLQNFFNGIDGGSIALPDVEGSGFYFTFTLAPGEMGVSFLYDFLTNEERLSAGGHCLLCAFTAVLLAALQR